jgi:hypothetical protein
MRRTAFAALAFLGTAVMIVSVSAQPGGDEKKEKKAKKEGKGPPKFTPGMLFPPGLRDELKLTAEQEKTVAAMEKELKEKLDKLLTAEQKKVVEDFRPRPPMGPPGGPGGPPEGAPMPKEKKIDGPQAKVESGIQWFATLDAGLAEAKRTGKPVLFLSAAPHCGGIPGMW